MEDIYLEEAVRGIRERIISLYDQANYEGAKREANDFLRELKDCDGMISEIRDIANLEA